jgi:HPt (histidine-containing phosphotransfer) domain-containing protein
MSSPAKVQPIELEHLAQYTGGDPRLDAELLQMFAQQCTEATRLFQNLCDAPNLKAWRETGHSLKGAAAGVGAKGVAEAASRLEETDPASKPKKAADCLLQLERQCEVAKAFIDAYLKR